MEQLLQTLDWSTVTSVICSGGTVSFFAKFIVNRAASKFDDVVRKLEVVTEKLIVVETRLDAMNDLRDMVTDHDRKIVDLDSKRSIRPVEQC